MFPTILRLYLFLSCHFFHIIYVQFNCKRLLFLSDFPNLLVFSSLLEACFYKMFSVILQLFLFFLINYNSVKNVFHVLLLPCFVQGFFFCCIVNTYFSNIKYLHINTLKKSLLIYNAEVVRALYTSLPIYIEGYTEKSSSQPRIPQKLKKNLIFVYLWVVNKIPAYCAYKNLHQQKTPTFSHKSLMPMLKCITPTNLSSHQLFGLCKFLGSLIECEWVSFSHMEEFNYMFLLHKYFHVRYYFARLLLGFSL